MRPQTKQMVAAVVVALVAWALVHAYGGPGWAAVATGLLASIAVMWGNQ